MMQKFSALLILFVLTITTAWSARAVTAVIEVNEDPWYTANRDTTFQGARLTRWYAPLPVFFEGWKSSIRDQIVEYRWDFGDGTAPFYGFNAAHVYEWPGTFTATLTVRDQGGATDTKSIAIEALPRTGKTVYYVDSQLGNDSNPGTSPGTGAWRTATKAFQGLTTRLYQPGQQVLFNRGQVFDVVAGITAPTHWKTGSGWLFGAYGVGNKPLIRVTDIAGSSNFIFYGNGVGMAHATFQDLSFTLTTPLGTQASFFYNSQNMYDMLFLRVELRDFVQGFTCSGGITDRAQSGVFIVGCTLQHSTHVQNYAVCSRYALLDNDFDYSGNHINYLYYMNCAVIAGNTFSRPAFGRAALRIDGGTPDFPSNNVQVSENTLSGWIDPIDGYPTVGWDDPASPHYDPAHSHNGGGSRYNYHLIYFAPNAQTLQLMKDIVFERNTVTDAERLMWIGDYENLTIRNNTFSTPDPSPDAYRVIFGHHYDTRPLKNIKFTNNVLVSNESRVGTAGVFAVNEYAGPAFPGQGVHEGIIIRDNTIVMQGTTDKGRYLYYSVDDPVQIAQVDSDHNTIYASNDLGLTQLGGTWQTGGTVYALPPWRTTSSHDWNTKVIGPAATPFPGVVSSPSNRTIGPIDVSYTGAADYSGAGLKRVTLWVKKGVGPWTQTVLSSSYAADTFAYAGMTGNDTYYFATQAEDNAGNVSPPPAGFGPAYTLFAPPSDQDHDGIEDSVDGTGDPDRDGIPNFLDTDSDNDRIPDSVEGTADIDGDGLPNYVDPDSDGDGVLDSIEVSPNINTDPYDPLSFPILSLADWSAALALLVLAAGAAWTLKRPRGAAGN